MRKWAGYAFDYVKTTYNPAQEVWGWIGVAMPVISAGLAVLHVGPSPYLWIGFAFLGFLILSVRAHGKMLERLAPGFEIQLIDSNKAYQPTMLRIENIGPTTITNLEAELRYKIGTAEGRVDVMLNKTELHPGTKVGSPIAQCHVEAFLKETHIEVWDGEGGVRIPDPSEITLTVSAKDQQAKTRRYWFALDGYKMTSRQLN